MNSAGKEKVTLMIQATFWDFLLSQSFFPPYSTCQNFLESYPLSLTPSPHCVEEALLTVTQSYLIRIISSLAGFNWTEPI